ncbi:MAG: gliding motility-associated C-terminal domain-containing protein [Saprospiraceae bacterium]|nr:gliding motility-associated C-terminal domain-containing protein [Saprospiraceae bacterium]
MRKFLPLTILLFIPLSGLFAQPEYYMSNQIVNDCEGFLYDSEAGDPEGTYDHNENYTFTICIPEADQIVMDFLSFCTEADFDSLRVYDGPDTLSMQIGPAYTGEMDPPQIIAYSGYLTVNFVSDPNVTCTGWVAFWSTVIEEPVPPDILPIGNVPCESNSMTITFDEPLPCDSLYAGAFSIVGPISPTVTSVMPMPCVGGMASTVVLNFSPPIDFSGTYQVIYNTSETICETVYPLVSVEPFVVNDCPLNVIIELQGTTACAGENITLVAVASGGDPNTYMFDWSPEPGNTDTLVVMPVGPTIYMVEVTDANGASATDTILVDPEPIPVLSLSDTSLCTSVDPFFLTAVPPGGEWSGMGIAEGEEGTGYYDPGLVDGLLDTVIYAGPNGCSATIFIDYLELDEGTDDAACPGSAPFFVSGGLPVGGVWTGPNIDPDGLFTPPATAGSFEVTYTHPNGCSGSKWINVDLITLPVLDSICQSEPAFPIAVSPFGGIWSGAGIVDVDFGIFDPNEAGPGSHQLIYDINGCSDTLDVFVKQIDAVWDLSACPEQAPFILPGNWQPNGVGMWSGLGIVDPFTGLYDPGLLNHGDNDTLTFSANGCTDDRIVFIRDTKIYLNYTPTFCPQDDAVFLDWESVQRSPYGGVWTGNGIVYLGGVDYEFDPGVAGPGMHLLIYTANTCVDSMYMEVFPSPQITSEIVCELASPIFLQTTVAGGTWSGPGITNEFSGQFDPGAVGPGTYTISYTSADGCYGEGTVEVTSLETVVVSGLEEFYCFKDTVIYLDLQPMGGTLTIDGVVSTYINPAELGTGTHIVEYTVGVDECEQTEILAMDVGQPIELILPLESDSICAGETVNLTATAYGGSSLNNFTYSWDPLLGFGQSFNVQPGSSTVYTVTASDACSDPAVGIIDIFVHPAFYAEIETGPAVCFEDTTWAEVQAYPGLDYSFLWYTNPPTIGNYVESYPTSILLEVTDNNTGCVIESTIQLPGYLPIQANFGLAPTGDCISVLDGFVQILDFSSGGKTGYWDFGDGSGLTPYQFGANLSHVYQDTGLYEITLTIENEGGCESVFTRELCISPDHRLFAPNAMTPNGDGVNDVFGFKGAGIEEITWQIFNRFGELMYEGQSMSDRWDGKYQGNRVQGGVYTVVAGYKVLGEQKRKMFKGYVTVLY